MIRSKFVRDILMLLIDGHKEEDNLSHQIELLEQLDCSYTGAGVIVTFGHGNLMDKYRTDIVGPLNGVRITSSELELGAESNLFFEEGLIAYLEIFSNSSVYPEKDLGDYRLSQAWQSDGGKIVEYP